MIFFFGSNENIKRNEGKFRNFEEEKLKYCQNIQNKPIFIVNKKKNNNNFFQSQNMSKYIYDLKNVNGANRYNNLFYKNNNQQLNNFIRLKSGPGKKKLRKNNIGSPNQNSNYNSYIQGKKIPIEHEVIQSLTNQQFMEKLGNYKNKGKSMNINIYEK